MNPTETMPVGRGDGSASASRAPAMAAPATAEATGLDFGLLLDLCLKTIYFAGRPSARLIGSRMALPFSVVEELLKFLRRQEYAEIVASAGPGEAEYQYALTSRGTTKTQEVLEKSQYVGPAPVPFDVYVELTNRQSVRDLDVDADGVAEAMRGLVLAPQTLTQLGTAVSSGRSIFIYGDPGNGKSTIAAAIGSLLPGKVLVPHAVEVHGQVMRVFDPRIHRPVEDPAAVSNVAGLRPDGSVLATDPQRDDMRWLLCRRPVVITGGELTLADLEPHYSLAGKFYIAPLQVKANNGLFVADDFGRQIIRPDELLNRWMLPMERGIDHLTLQTGETFEVPFDVLLVFATNLSPSRLGDEAFFRRIQHKVRIPDPDERAFRKILREVASKVAIPYSDEAATYLIDSYYRAQPRPFRGVHPRDIFNLIRDMSRFQRRAPEFAAEWIDLACSSYFVQD